MDETGGSAGMQFIGLEPGLEVAAMADLEHDPRFEEIVALVQNGENWEALRRAEQLRDQLEREGGAVPPELLNWINSIEIEGTEANEGELNEF